jgi:multiple sugar transport system permease protein
VPTVQRAAATAGARTPLLLMAPMFVFYILFWVTPVLEGIREVFTDLHGHFTLWGNFALTASSEFFGQALFNTIFFATFSVLLQFMLAIGMAMLFAIRFPGSKWVTFIAMIPMAITPTAVAILWKTGLLKSGWLNSTLVELHLVRQPLSWLNANGIWAVMLLVLVDTWTVTPSVMIILQAGLQGISKEFGEAAFIFGATRWRIFRDVTLPLLKPSIVTAVILRVIAAIQVWNIAVMVVGYNVAPFLVERVAYNVEVVPGLDTSRKIAFTLSFVTTLLVLAATVVYLRVSNRKTREA